MKNEFTPTDYHKPMYSEAEFDLALKLAYNQGWYECTIWAERDDLYSNVGSKAFILNRDQRLLGVRQSLTPSGDNND